MFSPLVLSIFLPRHCPFNNLGQIPSVHNPCKEVNLYTVAMFLCFLNLSSYTWRSDVTIFQFRHSMNMQPILVLVVVDMGRGRRRPI